MGLVQPSTTDIRTTSQAANAFVFLLLSPAVTLALPDTELTVLRIFTRLVYLQLLSSPATATALFQTILMMLAAVVCLQRVQHYFEENADVSGETGNGTPSLPQVSN